MTTKFQNKYRIESTRLKGYDYSKAGSYFVTICTQNREHYFGKIRNGQMELSEIGKIAFLYWKDIPNHISKIKLGEFIIMPDHMHGIIEIVAEKLVISGADAAIDESMHASTHQMAADSSLSEKNKIRHQMAAISPKAGSLGRIIGSYKSAVSKDARKIDPLFQWQSKYHDHIIRNKQAYHKISTYIKNNPQKWEEDKNSSDDKNQ